MPKTIKRILITLAVIFVTVIVLVFSFVSPITKYLIHKYDKQVINREVEIDGLWINIFSGTVVLKNATLFELDAKTPFFKFSKLESQISIPQLINGAYNINRVKLTEAQLTLLLQNGKYNYDDILQKFTSTDTTKATTNETPLKYWIKNIELEKGAIVYKNAGLNYLIEAEKINLSIPSIAYNDNNITSKIDFAFKSGGNIKANFETNLAKENYSIDADVNGFDLHVWFPFIKDLINTNDLLGNINATFRLKGNYNNPSEIALKGKLDLNHFALLDPINKPLVTCTKLEVGIDTLDVASGQYYLNALKLTQPYVMFEMYDNGNNFYRLLPDTTISGTQAIAEANAAGNMFTLMFGYVADIAKNFTVTNYGLNQFQINEGHIVYNDYTLPQRFMFDIDKLQMHSNNLRSANQDISLIATALLNKTGQAEIEMHINPKDFGDASLNYAIKNLNISDFNAYVNHYVGHSFLNGVIEYTSNNVIKQKKLNSGNNFVVNQVSIGGKSNKNAVYNLPMKLAVSMLKNQKGNIDLNIPISGDLADPNYNIGKVIWQVVKNLLLKAATAPYKLISNLFGGNEDSYKSIAFDTKATGFDKTFYNVLDNLAELAKQKPDINISLTQQCNMTAETEYIAVFEAKRQFYQKSNGAIDNIATALTDTLNAISLKDSSFITFVDGMLNNNDALMPIQQKCELLIGQSKLTNMVQQRMANRNDVIRNYFITKHQLQPQRIQISNTQQQSFANTQSINVYLINYLANDSAYVQP